MSDKPPPVPVKVIGVGASPGAAVGRAFPVDRRRVQEPRRHLDAEEIEAEIARLQDAIARSDEQLSDIRGRMPAAATEHALILDAHRLMLHDPELTGAATNLIRNEGLNAEWAVRRVVRQLSVGFDSIDDPYFRERRGDVEYVGDRIVRNLMGVRTDLPEKPPPNAVLVARDLSPADLVQLLGDHRVAGIVTEVGGRTSHSAIIARALEIPAVLGAPRISEVTGFGDLIALDGGAGVVVLHPGQVEQRAFAEIRRRYEEQEEVALATAELESRTSDGHHVALRANIELVEEIPSIIAHGADGIGLYRTEFLFLNRDDVPSEEEHYQVYRRLLEALPEKQVTVRTFDLGGEKQLRGRNRDEANPSLGLRAIRYGLAHPEMFLSQLRALWRASVHGNLRVMVPLISGVGELRAARRLFLEARDQVAREGHPMAESIPLGAMIETPGAALIADRLAKECAFFAIGTNDLIQYTIAIDRRNRDVSYLYNPLHPALLRLLRSVLETATKAGVPVSICGEMAGDPVYTLILLALGARELSMTGTAVPMVKQIIRSTSLDEARALLETAEEKETGPEIDRFVRDWMAQRFPDLCGVLPAETMTEEASADREEPTYHPS